MAGRPSKLNADRQKKIISALRSGCTREAACAAVGIDYSTFHRWMAKGRKSTRGAYHQFCKAVETTEAQVELACCARIMKSAQDDPKWAAWWLERRRKSTYAPLSKQEIAGADGGPLKVVYRIGGEG
jgi:hypothetical protein